MWSSTAITQVYYRPAVRYLCSASLVRLGPASSTQRKDTNTMKMTDPFFSNLRLNVIKVLTASLAHEQRQNLLSSLGALDKETAEQQKHSSVGEAVAKAIAQEAAKRDTLLEQEQENIIKRAQQAMEQRILNDIVIQERQVALERWKRELKQEEEQQQREKNTTTIQTLTVSKSVDAKLEEPSSKVHPILGPMLYDLGFKRVHLMSIKALSAIPIWSQQRSYRHDRAKIMAADKMKSLDLGLPGIISIHEVRTS